MRRRDYAASAELVKQKVEFLHDTERKEVQLPLSGVPEMIAISQDAADSFSPIFLEEDSAVAKKKTAKPVDSRPDDQPATGRPKSIAVTPEQLEAVAESLTDASEHLLRTAKLMRDNSLPTLTTAAAKVFDEHNPAVHAFARRVYSEVGPARDSSRVFRRPQLVVLPACILWSVVESGHKL